MIRWAAAGGVATIFATAGQAAAQGVPGLLTRLDEIGPAIRACWRVPPALRAFERAEATVRFSLRADGSLIGERSSFVGSPLGGRVRELLERSVSEAVRACTPLAVSPALGAAIAGRVFAVRFIYGGPRGRGA